MKPLKPIFFSLQSTLLAFAALIASSACSSRHPSSQSDSETKVNIVLNKALKNQRPYAFQLKKASVNLVLKALNESLMEDGFILQPSSQMQKPEKQRQLFTKLTSSPNAAQDPWVSESHASTLPIVQIVALISPQIEGAESSKDSTITLEFYPQLAPHQLKMSPEALHESTQRALSEVVEKIEFKLQIETAASVENAKRVHAESF